MGSRPVAAGGYPSATRLATPTGSHTMVAQSSPDERADSHPAATERSAGLPERLESLLFVTDGPVSIGRLADALGTTAARVEGALATLESAYAERGLRLQWMGREVQLVTAPEAAASVERLLGLETKMRFSRAALETLAIVAYRQPVTRPEIEAIRGVGSDSVIRTLLSAGLVEERGRAPTVGRPVLFGTTFEFLQHFGLRSIEELPPLGGASAGDEP